MPLTFEFMVHRQQAPLVSSFNMEDPPVDKFFDLRLSNYRFTYVDLNINLSIYINQFIDCIYQMID